MSERDHIQSSGVDVRLVVQRKMRNDDSIVRVKRTTVQVYFADNAKVSGGLHGSGSGSVFRAEV